MANNLLATTNLTIPKELADKIVTKARDASVIQALSPSVPQTFNDVSHVLFTKEPEAEFVGEGAAHSSMGVEFTPVQGTIKKAHVTVRMNDEVTWADEDSKLTILDSIADAGASALGRALDYAVIHGINPATGTAISGVTGLSANATAVTATADPVADLDSLTAGVSDAYVVSGLALSPEEARALRSIRIKNTGVRQFPEIPLSLQTSTVDGIPAATSATVNGRLAKPATNVLALAGDFSLIKWGIVRDFGFQAITMGDPDGLGDLKKLGQVAFRIEMVYSWAVLDPKGFAVLKKVAG